MKDTKLYEQILGLKPPWAVESVTLKKEEGEIQVEVKCADTVWGCPECGKRMHIHGYERRRWRHLDSCQYKTVIVADVPRVICDGHGTQGVTVPWAEKHSRFTVWFERLAIDLLLECSVKGACEILRTSWDEADGIKQRAVGRGQARKMAEEVNRICVDEKSFGRGHDYVTLVVNVGRDRASVEYIGDGRSQESLDAYWLTMTEDQRRHIEAIGMDLWEPYENSTRLYVPEAGKKIVHDPFHLVRHMNDAVDKVRKSEHRQLQKKEDDRLTKTKYLWLYGQENLPPKWADRMEELKDSTLKTAKAWSYKEMFRDFWGCRSVADARGFFEKWYAGAIRSRLEPVKRVARMFKAHLENILTYFQHKLTNAVAEGMNNKIQSLIKKAYGYRNRERFKTDILFHCGGLDLYPSPIN